jgi:hypothetical protein
VPAPGQAIIRSVPLRTQTEKGERKPEKRGRKGEGRGTAGEYTFSADAGVGSACGAASQFPHQGRQQSYPFLFEHRQKMGDRKPEKRGRKGEGRGTAGEYTFRADAGVGRWCGAASQFPHQGRQQSSPFLFERIQKKGERMPQKGGCKGEGRGTAGEQTFSTDASVGRGWRQPVPLRIPHLTAI